MEHVARRDRLPAGELPLQQPLQVGQRPEGGLTLPGDLIVIAPRHEHARFRDLAHDSLIDARWGLEEIIGHLAGFDDGQVGPPV